MALHVPAEIDWADFQIDGWIYPLSIQGKNGEVSICGNSVGLAMAADEHHAGGVMDYNEVAQLHVLLGNWLREVERTGAYKETRRRADELYAKFKAKEEGK